MRAAFGDYELDSEARTLRCHDQRIPVQSKAFDLLAYLIERRARVVSADELLDALWPGLHVTPAALSTAVQKARQAVGDDGGHQAVIHTEHGKGFRFVAEVIDFSAPDEARPGPAGAPQMPLIAELKRRNVFRVAAAYGIVAWLLVEIASVVLPTFNAPEWVMPVFTALVALGFPLALVFAWAFELTPEGIKRERDVDPAESITRQTGRKLDFLIIGVLAIAVVYFSVEKWPPTGPDEKSIAVLLFDNLSGGEDNEAFAKGIHDDTLTQLSKISALKVIARKSLELLDPSLSIPEIGAQLGVATVLEGGVQRAGDRIHINVQLIDCATQTHLWAETYDRELTAANIFDIQSEIATSVAAALRATLSTEEQERIATIPTKSLEAYQAYLLGRQRMAKFDNAPLTEAVDYFQQAIELDPDFALAYVGLAESYLWQASISHFPLDEMVAKARVAVDKAIELDDQLGEAHAVLADLKHASDNEGSEAAFLRALQLNPNYATTYQLYGWLLRDEGRLEEALAMDRRALELDPLSASIMTSIGLDLSGLGRFEEALAQHEKALEIDPAYVGASWIAEHYWLVEGQLDQAVVGYAKDLALDPGSSLLSAVFVALFLDLGDPVGGEYWAKRSIEVGPERFWPNHAMQLLGVYQGDEATAWDYGRKAVELWWNPDEYDWPALTLLRDHELEAGRYPEARALYEISHPELLNPEVPEVRASNYQTAIDLALVLLETGERERADLLLDRALEQVQTLQRLGQQGYMIADVQIHALRGNEQKALSALRQAIDEGWRHLWWYHLKHNPNLESLHDEPEYQAMVAEIEADIAAQLARVREMEHNGELAPIPEI